MLKKQSILFVQVLNQDETPLLYSLVFGEGVVNDATSVVLFNAIQSFDLSHFNSSIALQFIGNFLYLFITSTMLGFLVSLSLSDHMCSLVIVYNLMTFCWTLAGWTA
jgi:NhaP-type Na+/H+ or K+/H+ antiporter